MYMTVKMTTMLLTTPTIKYCVPLLYISDGTPSSVMPEMWLKYTSIDALIYIFFNHKKLKYSLNCIYIIVYLQNFKSFFIKKL